MLRRIERFRRIAAFSRTPGMRFHLPWSPVRLLRERLWLIARLQPRVVVHLSVSNPVHVAGVAVARISALHLNRTSLVLPRLNSRTAPALHAAPMQSITLGKALIAERSVVRINLNRTSLVLLRLNSRMAPALQAAPMQSITLRKTLLAERSVARINSAAAKPRQDATNGRQFVYSPVAPTPLAARLFRRTEGAEGPPDPPSRILRRPPAIARMAASAAVADAPGFASSGRLEQPGAKPAWPGRSDAPALLNVEQLTDQVLRQLDRRLIASRERIGRI